MIEAKVIEDSVSADGVRLVTFQLRYPRFIHAEFMTHRVFSRNASSSREIPVAKMIEQVFNNYAAPCHWGLEQQRAKELWQLAATNAAIVAGQMERLGLHKEVANRILEPFQFMHVVVTATEWDNFFALRDHHMAEPNIQALARTMKVAMANSVHVYRTGGQHFADAWHLPYVSMEERIQFESVPRLLAKLSTARCARVSYLTHDGVPPNMTKDLELFDRLVGSDPKHVSPCEHQGYPTRRTLWSNNFRGWMQHRQIIEAARG